MIFVSSKDLVIPLTFDSIAKEQLTLFMDNFHKICYILKKTNSFPATFRMNINVDFFNQVAIVKYIGETRCNILVLLLDFKFLTKDRNTTANVD